MDEEAPKTLAEVLWRRIPSVADAFERTRTHSRQKGADVHATDFTGQAAAHWAAVRGSISALELLLRSGASPMQKDTKGFTVGCVVDICTGPVSLCSCVVCWGLCSRLVPY